MPAGGIMKALSHWTKKKIIEYQEIDFYLFYLVDKN